MEIWKDIPGYEGKYQVSTLGRVKSVKREVRQKNGGFRIQTERILRPANYGTAGHLQVMLYSENKRKPQKVHRLVMSVFVGECPSGKEVRHLNGNAADNRLENLAYGTHKENMLDAAALGIMGTKKLSADDVREIRARVAAGETQKAVGADYGVGQAAVWSLCARRTYAWIK